MPGPLHGRRIIEIAHMLAGPYCGMMLADLGAEVIKVEGPEGDIGRRIGPHFVEDQNTYFASLNRNKKSVVLDLSQSASRAAFDVLVRSADGLITNLRPNAIRKLGLTYEQLRTVNPKIACLALTGYGLDGPYSDFPAYDYVIQAMTGIMAMTGDPGGAPVKPGYSAVDNSAGIMGAFALVAKLVEGRGGQIDVSMHDTMLSQLNYLASGYLNTGIVAERVKNGGHPYIVPAQIFPARTGHVVLFITHDKFWRLFAEELGRQDWLDDPRYANMQGRSANRDLVVDAVAQELVADDATAWVTRLAPIGLVIAAVQELKDALEGPLVQSREMVIDIPLDHSSLRLIGNPIRIEGFRSEYRRPPRLGEHGALVGDGTDEVE